MAKQVLISLSREYGSGGHYIAEKLSKELGVSLLDRTMLDRISAEKGIDYSKLKSYDEVPKNSLLSRKVRGISSSPEEITAHIQFDYITEKAKAGESFLVVGRCGDHVLKDYDQLITIFIMGDMEDKIKRIMQVRDMTRAEAEKAILRHDKKRKLYHNYFANSHWGDSRKYDLLINSSKLGLDRTVDYLKQYIEERIANQ